MVIMDAFKLAALSGGLYVLWRILDLAVIQPFRSKLGIIPGPPVAGRFATNLHQIMR